MADAPAGTWDHLKLRVRSRLNDQGFATWWVGQVTTVEDSPTRLVLGLPNLFTLDWVHNHYLHLLREELSNMAPETAVELRLDENAAEDAAPSEYPAQPAPLPAQPRLAPRPEPARVTVQETTIAPPRTMNPKNTFETFVTGPSNQLASAAAQSVAENPGGSYNPLFVFGRVGLGKTHLAQAIGHTIAHRNPSARVVYQTTESFVNDVIQGIRFERMEQVRQLYRQCDVLLIDDIQFIAGKETCQSEFFHTFNTLYDARKQVVVTSDKLPHEIKDLEERVRTRFQWGLIVDLQPPELETRVAIVKKKADTDGIPLGDEVAMFIAQSIRSNIRELEGCLIRVSAYASLMKTPISIELAKEVLRDVIPQKSKLTCEYIVKTVATHFDVKVSDLKSTRRGRAIAFPRQISMYLCRKHTDASYPEIGQALGGKDHTTALNAFHRIGERMEDPDVRRHVETLERQILDNGGVGR